MGLLAVIGPSRKDHFGLPRLISRSLSKARVFSQNASTARSWAGKSTLGSTLSNAMQHSNGHRAPNDATRRTIIGNPITVNRLERDGGGGGALPAKPPGRVFGEIGDDEISPGPFDGGKRFEGHVAF